MKAELYISPILIWLVIVLNIVDGQIVGFSAFITERQSPIEAATDYNNTVTETYTHTYYGFDEISTMNISQVDIHEAMLEDLSEQKSHDAEVICTVVKQQVDALNNSSQTQLSPPQSYTKKLEVTYILQVNARTLREAEAYMNGFKEELDKSSAKIYQNTKYSRELRRRRKRPGAPTRKPKKYEDVGGNIKDPKKTPVTRTPSDKPSHQPSDVPSIQPSESLQPSDLPSDQPSDIPSSQPSDKPSDLPSDKPSSQPSDNPSAQPSESVQPSDKPSAQPSESVQPSDQPSVKPSTQPSGEPSTHPSNKPSYQPSKEPSDQPSVSPSDKPSIHPTGEPSTQPSQEPSLQPSENPSTQLTETPSVQPSYSIQHNWNITIADVMMDASHANNESFAMLNLQFNISHGRMPEVKVGFHDFTCSQASKLTYLYEMSKEYHERNWGIIQIGVNKKDMLASNAFNNNTFEFCVRIDAKGYKDVKPISYDERIITMNFDAVNAMAPIHLSHRKIDPSVVTLQHSFKVDACICDVAGKSATCLAKTMKQNQQFDICIFSLSDVVFIDSVRNLQMVQDNKVKYKPITDGLDDPLTKSITHQKFTKTNDGYGYNAARVTTRVISSFFMDRPIPPVTIRGDVQLVFSDANQNDGRRLLESGHRVTEYQQFGIMFQPDDDVVSMVTRFADDTMAPMPTAYSADRKIDSSGVALAAFCVSGAIAAFVMVYMERRSRMAA